METRLQSQLLHNAAQWQGLGKVLQKAARAETKTVIIVFLPYFATNMFMFI